MASLGFYRTAEISPEFLNGGSFWIAPLLQATPYDVVRDFSPISSVITSPNVLVVHPSVAANSVKELIALAKAKPGALNFASSGTGGSSHLSGELFKALAGINIVHVPFKGSGAALASQLAGEVQLRQADVKEQFAGFGMEATGSTPEELAALLKSEIAKWGKLIKDAGIRAN